MNSLNQGKRSRIDESRGGIVRAIGGQAPDVMSTSRFAGVTVISVDGHDGRIAYVVLADGEFLGTGLTLRAIPWSALTFDMEYECFRLDMRGEQIKDAPAFDGDNWPSMADASWCQRMHKYYNRPPY